jgi:hypothetical protein
MDIADQNSIQPALARLADLEVVVKLCLWTGSLFPNNRTLLN